MSCDGCHHPLREGAWRQERGYRDRPGLVRWSPARWIILRQIVKSVAPGELSALERDVDALSRAVGRMNAKQVISASDAVSRRVGRIVPKIESASWDRNRAQSLINAIASEGRTFREADRQSAEQASYALLSLTSHLANQNPAVARGPLARQVDLLFKQVEKLKYPDEFRHDEFIAVLDEIQGRKTSGTASR
jgi:hypothetical protein